MAAPIFLGGSFLLVFVVQCASSWNSLSCNPLLEPNVGSHVTMVGAAESVTSNQQWVWLLSGQIQSKSNPTLCFDLGPSNQIVLATCTNDPSQIFVEANSSQIQNLNTGLCLDVFNNSLTDGTVLQVYGCHMGVNQQWSYSLADSSFSSFLITPNNASFVPTVCSPSVFYSAGAPATPGASIRMSEFNLGLSAQQLWSWPPTGHILLASNSELCMTPGPLIDPGSGQPSLTLQECSDDPDQVFSQSQNEAILNVNRNQCLDIFAASILDGTDLEVYDCSGNDNQQWVYYPGNNTLVSGLEIQSSLSFVPTVYSPAPLCDPSRSPSPYSQIILMSASPTMESNQVWEWDSQGLFRLKANPAWCISAGSAVDPSSGTPVLSLAPCSSEGTMVFSSSANSTLMNLAYGACITSVNGPGNGAQLTLASCEPGDDAQQFMYTGGAGTLASLQNASPLFVATVCPQAS